MEMKSPIQTRHQQALEAADRCKRLLVERFGARRVILFGSAAGRGVWHERSDLDLAVEGLAPERFFAAYTACCEQLPKGIELDLVPLERVIPVMRARILEEVEMPKEPQKALQTLVMDELAALSTIAQEMEDLLKERAEPPTRTELRAIAGILHEFYNGTERIFERLVVSLGEGLPQGSTWHTDLLTQTATAREGVRPAIISEPLRARLKDYLDFRHFFRHAYGYTLQWSQLRWKAESLSETLMLLRNQLETFFKAFPEK